MFNMRGMEVHTTQESDITQSAHSYMNLASCDRFLDTLTNEAEYCVTESDLEVANVLSTDPADNAERNEDDPSPFRMQSNLTPKLDTGMSELRKHSSSGIFVEQPVHIDMRFSNPQPSTVITNFTRGNVSTATPLISEKMSIHQMAAQGEIVLLQHELMNPETDIDHVDQKGFTALLWTCANGQKVVAELLLKYNANIEARGHNGENALLLAACYGHHEIVAMLLERGMHVNSFDEQGNTALMFAAYNNHRQCIELLLEYGADVTIESEDGLCAVDFAVRMGSKSAHQIIEERLLRLLEET